MLQVVNKEPIPSMKTNNSLLKNLFNFNWSLNPIEFVYFYFYTQNKLLFFIKNLVFFIIVNRWNGNERKRKPSINIQDIPIDLLKEIISHIYLITDTNYLSSLRLVCRSWNITINHLIYDEITEYSPELILWMRCKSHTNEIIHFEFPLQQGALTNGYKIEYFPRVDHKLKKQLFVDSYKLIDFFLLYSSEEDKGLLRKKKEISRFFMKSCKFASSSINSNNVIDVDLAFQYTPYEPLTFRVKVISFSPIYLLNLFSIKKENEYVNGNLFFL